MKLDASLMNKINAAVEEYDWDYEYIGVRVQDEPFEAGEIDHASHVWVNGEETEEELNGICAKNARNYFDDGTVYFGDHVAIICGNRAEFGEDDGELIISDPVVVEVLA